MKHLMKLYSLYFTLLMVVPCNHSALYSNVAKNIFNIELHQHCQHHEQKDSSDNSHHHSCTPFCACGVAHFVLDKPSFKLLLAQYPMPPIYRLTNTPDVTWATKSNEYSNTLVNDIWNPPQLG